MNRDKHYIIAEIGQAHDGSLGTAHRLIDLAAEAGAHAVKFQMHFADIESGPEEQWRVNFSYQDSTRYDYWKRMEFTYAQWEGLVRHCGEKKVDFMCSPFSVHAAETLAKLGTKHFKIASGEVNNYLMLDYINKVAEKIYLSTGMSDLDEVQKTIDRFDRPTERLCLLQCTTAYPVPLEDVGINIISEYSSRFKVNAVGLSDHSGKLSPVLMSYFKGARVFELHICLSKEQFGPDTPASLNPSEFAQISSLLNDFSVMENNKVTKSKIPHEDNRTRFGKSLVAKTDLPMGTKLSSDCLETKKPAGYGISPTQYEDLDNFTSAVNIKQGEFITWEKLTPCE